MKHVEVGGMSEAVYGIETLKRIKAEKLGDYTVLFCGPWDLERLGQVVEFCKKNGMRFVMDETFSRLRGVLRDQYAAIDLEKYNKLIADAGRLLRRLALHVRIRRNDAVLAREFREG